MTDVTATESARRFADLLDAVEHRGERFTIYRRGKAVAELVPSVAAPGSTTKALLRQAPPDEAWADDLTAVRELLEDRPGE